RPSPPARLLLRCPISIQPSRAPSAPCEVLYTAEQTKPLWNSLSASIHPTRQKKQFSSSSPQRNGSCAPPIAAIRFLIVAPPLSKHGLRNSPKHAETKGFTRSLSESSRLCVARKNFSPISIFTAPAHTTCVAFQRRCLRHSLSSPASQAGRRTSSNSALITD